MLRGRNRHAQDGSPKMGVNLHVNKWQLSENLLNILKTDTDKLQPVFGSFLLLKIGLLKLFKLCIL